MFCFIHVLKKDKKDECVYMITNYQFAIKYIYVH